MTLLRSGRYFIFTMVILLHLGFGSWGTAHRSQTHSTTFKQKCPRRNRRSTNGICHVRRHASWREWYLIWFSIEFSTEQVYLRLRLQHDNAVSYGLAGSCKCVTSWHITWCYYLETVQLDPHKLNQVTPWRKLVYSFAVLRFRRKWW